jgi:hypothetical protein
MVAVGENVGTLQSLWVEAEYVIDDEDAVFGGRVACDIFCSQKFRPMVSDFVLLKRSLDKLGDIQVFRPSTSVYLPLGS